MYLFFLLSENWPVRLDKMTETSNNPFSHLKKSLDVAGKTCTYYDITALGLYT